jgi:uroporphyrinogen decarboxylase
MRSDAKILVQALQGKDVGRIPFWFMRQAGRYLPEYRELRARHKNFLEFCYTPEAAAEATIQPIRRFGMDGAIIFSDILVIPHALGANVWFEEGHGPKLTPIRNERELSALNAEKLSEKLSPVYEALKLTKSKLPRETALIGFAGAPWTIACYMIEGGSSKEFAEIRRLSAGDKEFFAKLIGVLTEAIIVHLKNQIRAGAEVVQLFDSWAGILEEKAYQEWSVAPAKKIVAAIKAEFPDVPIVGFPRQSGTRYLNYARETGVDAVNFDQSVPIGWVKDQLQPEVTVQGCLNPELLATDKDAMLIEAAQIIASLRHKPFVFNLGHGILPPTPIANMQALCDYLKNAKLL